MHKIACQKKNYYGDIETLRAHIKALLMEFIDRKVDEPPKFSYLFKNFPDSKKLDFGMKLGTLVTFVMLEGQKKSAKQDMVKMALREAFEDLQDTLLLKYQKIT